MKRNNIEEFVQEHRQDFDDLEPTRDLWTGIRTDLDSPNQVRKTGSVFWKLAAAVLLVMTSVLAYMQIDQWRSSESEIALAPELEKAEMYYTSLIQEKKEVIASYAVVESLDPSVNQNIEQLDSMYAVLKKSIPISGNEELVIGAMVKNLRLRVEILNQQIKVLEQIKKIKNNENINI